ncbi:MAG: type IV secretory system conjugative DNA transfer family protein, partial [Cocleimonas sp.]|nr:type IV secretory system conjugative DNA transfer family protein [Cocleimonas sp.]
MIETLKMLLAPAVLVYLHVFPVIGKIIKGLFMLVIGYPLKGLWWVFRSILFYAFPKQFGLGKENAKFLGFFARSSLLSPFNSGLLLNGASGRLSEEDSFKNLVMIAATGWGKSSGFIVPNILKQEKGSLVITDPSGDIFKQTSGHLLDKGYRLKILNPLDISRSIKFNPLHGLKEYRDIDEIAHILVSTANPDPKDPFWNESAKTIISIISRVLCAHQALKPYANLANVLHLLNNFEEGEPLVLFITTYADKQTETEFKGFVSQSPNTLQSILSTAKTSLKAFADPDIASLTASNDFDFKMLREEKTALFLIFPQNRISYYSFLMNLFYTKLFHYCLDDEQFKQDEASGHMNPIYFLLDEFGHLRIPDFASIITTTRKRNISISIILQSISQLKKQYGEHDSHTILNGGIASRIFSSGLDNETNRMLTETLGKIRQEIHTTRDGLQVKDDNLL